MTSHRVQKWIERGEEVKANLAALIDSHLLVNSDGQLEFTVRLLLFQFMNKFVRLGFPFSANESANPLKFLICRLYHSLPHSEPQRSTERNRY